MRVKVIKEFRIPKTYHGLSEMVTIPKDEIFVLSEKMPPYPQIGTHVVLERCSDGHELLLHHVLLQEFFERIGE